MDSKDLEVAGTFKVLGYELTLDEALTLQMNLSTALNISYGEQHEAPAITEGDTQCAVDTGCSNSFGPEATGSLIGGDTDTHIPLAPIADALKAEEANILKHEEWKSGWLKGMAEEMNKLTRECAANASR